MTSCSIIKSIKAIFVFILQVSKSKFDDMRYNVALALKEIDDLEKRSILKIKDKA